MATLLGRESWTPLLKAVASGAVNPGQIDLMRRPLLLNHKNPEVTSLARTAFGKALTGLAGDLQTTIKAALKATGNHQRQAKRFSRVA